MSGYEPGANNLEDLIDRLRQRYNLRGGPSGENGVQICDPANEFCWCHDDEGVRLFAIYSNGGSIGTFTFDQALRIVNEIAHLAGKPFNVEIVEI